MCGFGGGCIRKDMKAVKTTLFIGLLLVILGGTLLIVQRVSYHHHQKRIALGNFEATVGQKAHYFQLPAVIGFLCIIAGGTLLVVWFKKRSK